MQQFSQVCMLVDHNQKQIEYVCVFPECNQSRFACCICVQISNHKHQQSDQSHVLDHKALYEFLQEKLLQRQKQQSINNKQLKQGMDQNQSEQLKEMLLKLRFNGFNQFDDVSIITQKNIDQQVCDINAQILDQSNGIIQNAIKYNSQQEDYGLEQKIKDSKCKVITQDQTESFNEIYSAAISNDFKYIVSGGTKQKIKIWKYINNKLIKQIKLDDCISKIKFTDDSRLLYVGVGEYLCQFDVNNNFKETYKEMIHSKQITNIFCITNTIILTCSSDKIIIKTDVNLKQQLLLIKAHDDFIFGLDYNHNLDMIASSSFDMSIKIWNCQNGQLVLQKQNAHQNKSHFIIQILFIIKGNKLVSLDSENTIFVWKINYETKQLEQQQQINDANDIYNIQLVLNQQYITLVCSEYIKIYSIKGDCIKQVNHDIKHIDLYNNTIQPQSMKAIIIQGINILQICKLKIDLN